MFVIERLVSVFAPHTCLSCGREGSIVCNWCLPDAVLPLPERCYKCYSASPDSQVCIKCRKSVKLAHVWVRTEYTGLARQLVYALKFNRSQAAAEPIARLMTEALPWLAPNILIAHIPTASSRRRSRGYDHAELLARQLARIQNLRYATLLARQGQSRQVGAKRQERLKQLEHAYYVCNQTPVQGAHILLVDDITTTGATLEAAAKVLKQAGAKTVDAVVFAQKQ